MGIDDSITYASAGYGNVFKYLVFLSQAISTIH